MRHGVYGAPEGTILGRMGGDEYALWLLACWWRGSAAEAERLATAGAARRPNPSKSRATVLNWRQRGHFNAPAPRCQCKSIDAVRGRGLVCGQRMPAPVSPRRCQRPVFSGTRLSLISQLPGAIRAHQFEVLPAARIWRRYALWLRGPVRWEPSELDFSPDKSSSIQPNCRTTSAIDLVNPR